MSEHARIFVAGHRGLVGGAIVRRLLRAGGSDLVTRTHAELDLTQQSAVDAFFRDGRIDQVYLAAARVGGIHANSSYPADFIRDNLQIQNNVIDRGLAPWRPQAAVPWFELHLSEVRTATDA